jgi:ABC-type uncharacterized transport system permease subunit
MQIPNSFFQFKKYFLIDMVKKVQICNTRLYLHQNILFLKIERITGWNVLPISLFFSVNLAEKKKKNTAFDIRLRDFY